MLRGPFPGCIVLLSLAASALAGQVPSSPSNATLVSRGDTGRMTVRAFPVTGPFRVDGRLDDEMYRTVEPVDQFTQQMPREGGSPTERTQAWIFFDKENLYVAARCWDQAPPSQWVANEMRRDNIQLSQNESFAVALDTFNDRRNGFMFIANALGALTDGTITDEGLGNRDWNTVWEIRTALFDGGWTIEMAIPFKSLRYRKDATQDWGIQFRRIIRHKNEFIYLSPAPASAGISGITRVSAGAALVGLEVPSGGKNVEVKPYGISSVTTDRRRIPAISSDVIGDGGVDVKYGVTANLTADVTYNTDFAQVEIDEQAVNLTRFSLLFPEKREFFLEGRGILEFARVNTGQGGMTGPTATSIPVLFYSRRIGLNQGRVIPIEFGGRIAGKVGKYGVTAMNIQTGREPLSATPVTNFSVFRVRRDILRRSSIGALFANRSQSVVAPGSNQTYGVDLVLSFFQNLNINGYVARTRTPGREGDDGSELARLDYAGDRYGLKAEYLGLGANFNPEVGFVGRTDIKRGYGEARFSPRTASNRVIRQYFAVGSLEYIANGAGRMESRDLTGRFEIDFESSDRVTVESSNTYELLVRPFQVVTGVVIPPGQYRSSEIQTRYRLGPQRRVFGSLGVRRGQFYGGTITAFEFSGARAAVTKQLSLEPGVSVNRMDLPIGRFTTNVLRLRSDFGFTPRQFVSTLIQFSSADHSLSSNLRYRWEYQPGSEFFLVYTDEHDTAARGVPGLKNRAAVVKLTKLFRF